MRVLQVVPSLDAAQGGIRTSVPGINRALAEAGVHAECACVGEPQPAIEGITVRAFKPGAPRLTRASGEMKQWLAAHAKDYDAVIAHTLWLSPTRYAIDSARAAGRLALLVPHGMLDPDALAHHAWRKRLRWLQGEGRRVRACTLVFSTGADARRALSSPGVAELPHCVAPNPVDGAWFEIRREAPGPVPRILCLNRWHPRKGVLEFVQSLALLHSQGLAFKAGLAGNEEDAAYAARVRRAAAPLVAAGKLELHGLCDSARVRTLMARADIVVHPATGFENFGNVIAEAAAAGAAVVASPRALLAPDMAETGALIAAEPEPQALAAALARLVNDPAERRRLAQAGREFAQRFTSAQVGAAWRKALESARNR
jgi:glycosyltransferase involved in cell wall biosynthesis